MQESPNNIKAYGKLECTNRCLPAPYCGDKAVQADHGEKCDDGVNSGKPGSCATDCSAYIPLTSCGNGTLDKDEQCDDGAKNGLATDTCDAHCRFRCGNGIKDSGEACDDGVNNGAYGTCNSDCTLAPYCGDGVQNGTELCDLGAKNVALATAYGAGVCTSVCTKAPYCGDGRVQSAFEDCDGTIGCSSTCTSSIPH